MPIRKIPGTNAQYRLLAVNEDGVEAANDPDIPAGRMSDAVIAELAAGKVSDVFFWSHGWKGDVKEAFDQYDRWIGAFDKLQPDRQKMAQKAPGFNEMHIGFHWPSLAWGNEGLVSGNSFAPSGAASEQAYVDFYADALGDTPEVRAALEKLFGDLRKNAAAEELTPTARAAYLELDAALGLSSEGVGGDPASDRKAFDPDQAVLDAEEGVSFGSGSFGSLLAPLQQLSFWTMKKRAKTVGEKSLHALLARIQTAAPNVRIHLMGHSFGCIVMCSALGGPGGTTALPRPVDSCVLVQGAMSLWALAPSIPAKQGVAGYFSRLVPDGKVSGALVTTRSKFDKAVGTLYPWAAGVAGQVAYEALPVFGAIGAFGICGIDAAVQSPMLPADGNYAFKPKGIYNLDGSTYIAKGGGFAGAHSDIDGPEVAHVIWQAALPA
ncbi:hypothetical protein [Ramlibacter sp. WS9]|uniref:hypothetical protein n=1 Tax=Ramlibacter sp. WS9 TaxID=1882741 RepID=UPI0011427CA6|nr:hypothetical protein [Ramlibacter sp. WS9]ROZ63405.1 hypothetical protein EEB15_29795 [Ramlibacter sp. WS9]